MTPDRSKTTDRQTQLEAVAAALLARHPVDQVTGLHKGWGLRLGALIHRLRCKGWPIRCQREHGCGLGHYSLPPNWRPLEGEKAGCEGKATKAPQRPATTRNGQSDGNGHRAGKLDREAT